jgi:hypothetical protein
MKKLGGTLEGVLLVALGTGMAALVDSNYYWLYLNPKFTSLTAATALLLITTGVVAALHPNERPNLSGIALFALFGCVAVLGFARASQPMPNSPRAPLPFESEPEEARLTANGRDYVKINTAELYLSAEQAAGETAGPYVLQGFVKRSPELDRSGHFMLLRLTISCCLADAVAVGLRVQYDRVGELEDGQWLQVFTDVRPTPADLPNPVPAVKSAIFWVVHPRFVLLPHTVNRIDAPEIPFIFQVRDKEPYAY